MKNIKGFLYWRIKNIIQFINWLEQVSIERSKITYNRRVKPLESGVKIILIPHSDDEWIGCNQLIINDEVVLCNLDMSGGDSEKTHYARFLELQNTAKKYGKELITIFKDKPKEIALLIKKKKPEYILLPFYLDWNEEHIIVMKEFREALNILELEGWPNTFRIAMYQVSVPLTSVVVTNALPLTKRQWKTKWKEFVKNYNTQKIIPYRRFAFQEYVNGKITNTFAAEVYSVLNVQAWIEKCYMRLLSSKEIENILYSLNDISKIRAIISACIKKRLVL